MSVRITHIPNIFVPSAPPGIQSPCRCIDRRSMAGLIGGLFDINDASKESAVPGEYRLPY
jgi:hypothetical protein